MKITSFNPLIVTKDPEPVIALFEALGFERRHRVAAVESDGTEIVSVRMKDANGFYVDVAQAPNLKQDLSLIRMNVPDFDEAYEFLTARGFKGARGGETLDTRTNRSAMMVSPSGFAFDLCQHIKD